jgi:RNA polymerase sigma-B factor
MLVVSTPARGDRRVDELRLARYARSRDPRERAWLIRRYMPLARRLAARYHNRSEAREDLLQVATIGLILAIERYDPDRGSSLTNFAVPTILGELRRHLRDNCSGVHVPRGARELADRLPAAEDDLVKLLGRSPTAEELAERVGRPVEQIREARAALACRTVTSLDHPVGDRGETLADTVDGGDGGVANALSRIVLDELLAELPPRGRAVVRLYFHADLTQRQIGELLCLSQPHIGRILRESLEKMTARSAAAGVGP